MIPYFIKNKANYQLRKGSYIKKSRIQVKLGHVKGVKNARRNYKRI